MIWHRPKPEKEPSGPVTDDAGRILSPYQQREAEHAANPPRRKDWAYRVAPLMGACPYMPKKKV